MVRTFTARKRFFRKFLASGLQYKANALMVGGDVTGKAMIPVIHQGGGRYRGHLFGADEAAATPDELEKLEEDHQQRRASIPIVLEKDEAEELEGDPARMGARFEQEMCQRVREWMTAGRGKARRRRTSPCTSWPATTTCTPSTRSWTNSSTSATRICRHFEMDGGYEVVGLSNANMTPWLCARDVEEDELADEAGRARRHDPSSRSRPLRSSMFRRSAPAWTPAPSWTRT